MTDHDPRSATGERAVEPSASVGAGRGLVVDAADVDLVLRARQLRRRLRLLGRVFRVFFIVAVVGCCGVAFVWPSYARMPCRSEQNEAKGNLKALYVANESYRAEFDRYIYDFDAMGYAPRAGTHLRYRYVVTDATDTTFRAWAFRVDGVHDDVWTITQQNDLQNVVNGCQ